MLHKKMLLPAAFATVVLASSHSFGQTTGRIEAVGAGEFEESHPNFPPENVIDGDTSFQSRWASLGEPRNVWVDLGSVQDISEVGVAWGRGDSRSYRFEIRAHTSLRGSWPLVFRGESSGDSDGIEVYDVDDIDARYVRVKIFENDASTYQNVTEVEVYGPTEIAGSVLPINRATGESHPVFTPSRAIDGDLSFESRFASNANPDELRLDLFEDQDVSSVNIAWARGDSRRYTFEIAGRQGTSGPWTTVFSGTSTGTTSGYENYDLGNLRARQVRVRGLSNSAGTQYTDITEIQVLGENGNSSNSANNSNNDRDEENTSQSADNSGGNGDFGLDPNKEPWENFDLSDWVIDTPAFASDGESERFGENDWDDISDESRRFFFTHTDGGMRFVTRLDGARTSTNTSFVRSELREMLRRGDRSISTTGVNPNNWRLGYQPGNGDWGGRNGVLSATLRVNKVTTTGNGIHVGRTIIGQIHADDDEPARLYYRKEPGDDRGCIYLSHEIRNSDDVDFDIIGDEDCDNPSNGIALDELFSYQIINEGSEISIVVRRGDVDGPVIGRTSLDMDDLNSGYDRSDEWMYFKAGAYTQNNRGSDSDGDIITFYRLTNTHDRN